MRPVRLRVTSQSLESKGLRRAFIFAIVAMILGPPTSGSAAPGAALSGVGTLSLAYWLHIAVWLSAGGLALLSLDLGQNAIPFRAILRRAPVRLYLVFCGLALGSAVYSVSRLYTLFFGFKLVVSALLAIAIVVRFKDGARVLLRSIFIGTAIGWILVALGYVFVPQSVGAVIPGIGYRLTGGFLGDYGSFAAITGLGLLSTLVYGRGGVARFVAASGYALSWYFVVLSRTRSTIFGALAMLVIILLLHPRFWIRVGTVYAIGFVGLLAAGFSNLREPLIDFLLRGQEIGQVVSGLSGRRGAFEYGLQVWEESQWLGYGFGAGSTAAYADYAAQTGGAIGSAHDAVSKVLLDLGLIGVIVLLVVALAAAREMILLLGSRARLFRSVAIPIVALFAWSLATSLVSGGIADVSIVFAGALAGAARISIDRIRSGLGSVQGQTYRPRVAEIHIPR